VAQQGKSNSNRRTAGRQPPLQRTPKPVTRGVRRIPQNSFLYARLVPLALIVMAVLLVLIIIVAFAFMVGFIKY
jgi:hypothetical protein